MEITEHSLQICGPGTTPQRVEWTVREYAQVEKVSERTVWTWIAKGAVTTRRTPGGRVRIVSRSL